MKKYRVAIPTIILISILLCSMAAPVLAPYDPQSIDMENRLSKSTNSHPLGTDSLGRDTLSKVIYGGRKSIVLAFLATILSMLLGIAVGFLAGYYGGRMDLFITNISNIFLGLPGISIMIAFAGILGPGMKSLLIAIIINSWVGFSRIVRGEVMRVRNEYFIDGLVGFGMGDFAIFIKHILPNLSDTLVILFANRIGTVILSVSTLSYLGLGLQPPQPDWSIMISDAQPYFRSNPLLVVSPGLCIVTFVWCIHMIGDYFRDKLDISEV